MAKKAKKREKPFQGLPMAQFTRSRNPRAVIKALNPDGQKNWRPTVVCLCGVVLRKRKKKRKVGYKHKTDFIKGGIDRIDQEDPLATVYRELAEEANLDREDIVGEPSYVGHALMPLDSEDVGQGRDGYKRGKLYLIYIVRLCRGARFAAARGHGKVAAVKRTDLWNFFPRGSNKRKLTSGREFKAVLNNCRRV